MITVAFLSVTGGSGTSTLTATTAALLAQQGKTILAFEMDPQNMLGHHFGLSQAPSQGLVTNTSNAADDWSKFALRHQSGAIFVPFGESDLPTQQNFEKKLAEQTHWLKQHIEQIDLPDAYVLIDAHRMPSVYAQQALRAADYCLIVFELTPLAYMQLPKIEQQLAQQGINKDRCLYLPSQYNPVHILHGDILTVLKAQLKERVVPYAIHYDAHIPEAFARRSLVLDQTSQARAAEDFAVHAKWILQNCAYNYS